MFACAPPGYDDGPKTTTSPWSLLGLEVNLAAEALGGLRWSSELIGNSAALHGRLVEDRIYVERGA
jgi:hypothetical protein